MATRLVSALLLLLLMNVEASSSSSSTSSSSSQAESVTTAEELAQSWFIANFDDNETQLAVGVNSALGNMSSADVICDGVPSVQRRSDELSPNGGCPNIFSSVNASCTCLTSGFSDAEAWEFRVSKRSKDNVSYPTEWTADDVLPIDSIRTLLVPSAVLTLRIAGVGDSPQQVTFVPEDQDLPGTTLPIAANADNADADPSITAVEISNIDMYSITQTAASFLPANTLNLTLRSCNITKFGYSFLKGLDSVQTLDLSMNNLTAAYAGSSIATSCSNSFCAVEILNLTGNKLSAFPEVVFNLDSLQELYIANNSITDFNISDSLFASVSSLRSFSADLPAAATTCSDGTWETAHGAKFCVTNSTASVVVETTSSGHHSALIYGVIACGCVLVLLLAVFIRQRFFGLRRSASHLSSSKEDEIFDSLNVGDTFNFDDTHEHIDTKYLEDPVVVTNRIEYKHLKVGKCISRGGFGLVFAGEYHGRRVAIKKIRPDRGGDVAEIETFLREIILMAQLYHPRIVEFVGVAWDVLRHLSAVTEFMDHGDLRNVLYGMKQQGQPLSWEGHKTGIALQIAEALSYLHSLKPKVIHRDLKSKNVLMNLHLEAKLSDFGISRQRTRMETHLTVGIGTSFWIAPEVLLGHDYDERADIYSYGVVLSEIDTDDYPYWNDANAGRQNRGKLQEAEILSLVGEGKIRPSFSDSCPRSILELADCCLQRDPADRPAATEIVVMLQHILHSSERSSSPSPRHSTWLVPQEAAISETSSDQGGADKY